MRIGNEKNREIGKRENGKCENGKCENGKLRKWEMVLK